MTPEIMETFSLFFAYAAAGTLLWVIGFVVFGYVQGPQSLLQKPRTGSAMEMGS